MRRPYSMRPGAAIIASIFVLALSACATPPPASDPEAVAEYKQLNDPLEPANRKPDEAIRKPKSPGKTQFEAKP